MKILAGLIPFNRMAEFKIVIKLAKWYLNMLQSFRRTHSRMHSVTLTLREAKLLEHMNKL